MRRLLLLLVFFPLAAEAQLWLARDTISARDIITLVFSGDVMQHDPQIQGAWDEEKGDYDYMPCFQYIRPYWEEADVVIANLETTLSDRGFSGYPQFCAPWQLARDLRESGVDILTTNNNHSCDKGGKGVQRTLHYLDSLGMPHTGTYADTAAWIAESPLYIRHGQFKIALLSYTYGTNGLPPGKGQVVGMIDTFHIARQIEKARLDTATNIIAFMHWGIEYDTLPNGEQKRLARFLHARGADIVIGSHPHVVQPVEYEMRAGDTVGVTVYSLGNFVSNQSQRRTNGGISLRLKLERQRGKTRYRMDYAGHYVYRPIEEGRRRYYAIPLPDAPRLLGKRDSVLWREFREDTERIIGGVAGKWK